jgi:hypothetical protein
MWAQTMIEYGVLDAAIAGVSSIHGRIDAALGDGTTRWILLGGGLMFLYWVFKRR